MQLWREVTCGTANLSFRLSLEEFLENSTRDASGEKGKSHRVRKDIFGLKAHEATGCDKGSSLTGALQGKDRGQHIPHSDSQPGRPGITDVFVGQDQDRRVMLKKEESNLMQTLCCSLSLKARVSGRVCCSRQDNQHVGTSPSAPRRATVCEKEELQTHSYAATSSSTSSLSPAQVWRTRARHEALSRKHL